MTFAFRNYKSDTDAPVLNTSRLCGAAVLLAVLFAGTAEAATYHVSTAGKDTNSCVTAQSTTQSNQKRTVSAGVACAVAGDTVYIHGGTYTGGTPPSTRSVNGAQWHVVCERDHRSPAILARG